MNFGLRLPGPFRVGVSSRGRVSAGLTLGPVSVSGNLGGGRRPAASQQPAWGPLATIPISLAEATTQAEAQGWKVSYRGERAVWVQRGLRARVIEQHPNGVLHRPTLGPRALITGVVALVLFCVAVVVLIGLSR
jgi:hypothetical protein